MARTWGPDVILKGGVLLMLLVAVFVVMLGGGLNNIQVKYSRYHEADKCAHGLFVKEIEDSHFCCDDHYHETDWACMAAYDPVNKHFTSYLAWVIPLIPFLCTVLAEAQQGSFATSNSKAAPNRVAVHARRLILYIALFIYRRVRYDYCVIILYMIAVLHIYIYIYIV
jgi:hypothetical protein